MCTSLWVGETLGCNESELDEIPDLAREGKGAPSTDLRIERRAE